MLSIISNIVFKKWELNLGYIQVGNAITKLELQQTPLAFLSPPNQRSKSRYMNVDVLVQWGQKILTFLSVIERDEKAYEKLGWIIEYRDYRMGRNDSSDWFS